MVTIRRAIQEWRDVLFALFLLIGLVFMISVFLYLNFTKADTTDFEDLYTSQVLSCQRQNILRRQFNQNVKVDKELAILESELRHLQYGLLQEIQGQERLADVTRNLGVLVLSRSRLKHLVVIPDCRRRVAIDARREGLPIK